MALQVVEEGIVKLKQLQILGKSATGSGLAVFQYAATAANPSEIQQVLAHSELLCDSFLTTETCHCPSQDACPSMLYT